MRIIPLRNMRLGGEGVIEGVAVTVDQAEGQLALRHGWAIEAPAKQAKADKADKAAAQG